VGGEHCLRQLQSPIPTLAMLYRSSCKFIFWFCDTVYKNVRG
jgi:hypothetical protein